MKEKKLNYSIYIIFIVSLVVIALAITYSLKPKIDTSLEYEKDDYSYIINNLISGGVEQDQIPSIDSANYITVDEAEIDPDEIIYGIDYNGFVAAYPQNIMYWHEIVNEVVQGEKISVTYCPLTGTIIGYIGHELGVSGELYNSNLVMYDRETGARIPQILGKAIETEIQGKDLETFNVVVTSYSNWTKQYPNTLVLDENTGFNRDYNRNPYPGYETLLRIWFPVAHRDDTLNTKEWVLGVEHNNEFAAIVIKDFNKNYPQGLDFELGGDDMRAIYNQNLNTIEVNNLEVTQFESYWFAWVAYHPNTKIFK